jgi:Ca-activated chloride channel family protein
MKFDPNDPKWTAYALGELPAAERAEVEREIAQHPEAGRLVEEIRVMSGHLKTALAREPEVGLETAKREELFRAARRAPAGRRLEFPTVTFAWIGAAAAVLAISLIGLQYFGKPADRPLVVAARIDTPEPAPAPADERIDTPAKPLPAAESATAPEYIVDFESPVELAAVSRNLKIAEPEIQIAQASPSVAQVQSPLVMKGLYAGRNAVGRERLRQEEFSAGKKYPALWRANGMVASEAPPDQSFLSPSLDDFPEVRENKFVRVSDHPLSTFSIDVDTASYSVMRKFLNDGRLPPADAVRIEELINYFPYSYAPPRDETPFAAHLEVAPCPWQTNHPLVRIALKGREIAATARPPMNLVFLIDVSGSMRPANRLPLVKRALQALVKQLDERDRIAIVVYAGAAGLVQPPTTGHNTQALLEAIERLEAGGSTAGGAGIQLAYNVAREHFDAQAVNRVILCTDGDFNVGLTQRGDLERLIEQEAKSGVFLTVLGFGMGNYKDSTLEVLSNKGNGNYAYIDDFGEARKVLVDQMLGTLVTIAKDVKIQVEFNPARVAGYRLVGYENRLLKKEDFNDDRVDAGDIGAGHTVTAFYEIIPAGQPVTGAPAVDDLKYQAAPPASAAAEPATGEWLTVKLRYKQPDGETSSKLEFPLPADAWAAADPSRDFRFAAAVAGFGQLLRDSEHKGALTYDQVLAQAESALGDDPFGYRAEFVKLVRNARAITGRP